ncbi:hypothetical protein HYALB_00007348 [Hymenoscyphus albidus]|uniref:Uncharacterized protein n=1 Tax=Hymenoscyphus albidus TaxID=595503 RepID=A0A9N9LJB0_9HELO|nr:hypothetical protein HYALB_00007348 [Hymenoscyphus albidus]
MQSPCNAVSGVVTDGLPKPEPGRTKEEPSFSGDAELVSGPRCPSVYAMGSEWFILSKGAMTEFLQPLQVGYANSKPQALYKTPGSFSSNIELIRYSAYTPWLFPVSDLKDIVGLGYFFGVLSVLQGPFLGFKNDTRPWDLICRTSLMLIWSWTQLLTFNLQYQRNPKGIAEDAINKPWRPIPSGRISRYAASCLLYCAFPAQKPPQRYWNRLFLRRSRRDAYGNTSLLSTPKALCWLILRGLTIFLTVHTQDFRDMKGDKAQSRRTIPLVFSEMPARYSVVVGALFCSCVAPLFWGLGAWGFLLPGTMGLVMVVNLLGNRTLEGDKLSWKLWAY